MSGNLLVRFDEGRVGRTQVSPSLLLYRDMIFPGPQWPRHLRRAAAAAGLRGPTKFLAIGQSRIRLGVGGDLITKIDGRPVESPDALTRVVAQREG